MDDPRFVQLASQVAGVGYWRRDVATDARIWSDQMFALHGLTRRRGQRGLRDDEFLALYAPEDRGKFASAMERIRATGEGVDVVARMRRASDGAERTVAFRGEPDRAPGGEIVGLIGVMRDVTDRRAAAEALAESETRYRLLAEASTDIVLRVDADDVIHYVSPSVSRYGYTPRDLVGRTGFSLVHPDDQSRVRGLIGELFATGAVDPQRDRCYRVRTAAGDWVWMEGNPSVIRDPDGVPVAVISQLRDVSERVAAAEKLAASEARFRQLADNASDLILETGLDGAITYVSPSCFALTGRKPEEVVGRTALKWTHPDDAPRLVEAFQTQLKHRGASTPKVIEYRITARDGREIWLESSPRALVDPASGEVLCLTDVARDVTARKALEQSLSEARLAAEEAARVKAAFMANMSHEIRTPLTAILGFTSLLAARDDLPGPARRQVGRIASAGQALLAIVNDILDFSKLEAGQMATRPRPVRPAEILAETLELFQPQASAKGLELSLDLGTLPPWLSLDPDKLRQVVVNLVGNAVKFTQTGAVTLAARYADEVGRLQVEVRDTGCGMSTEDQAKLFQRFSQIDGSLARAHNGTGLGLAISRALVEAMGGEIGVVSRPGEGSVFHVSVRAPIVEAPPMRGDAPDKAMALDLRILVADDNAANRELARVLLEALGAEVTEAASGADALAAAGALPFDVILMDLRMPDMEGGVAARRIRDEPGPNQTVPILAFTADVRTPALTAQSGPFDGVVRKPIESRELLQALAACLDYADGEGGEAEHAR